MNDQPISNPLSLKTIQITDEFWKAKLELVRTQVIPYQWNALNDQIEGAEPSFCMRNFRLAGRITKARQTTGAAYQTRYPTDKIDMWPKDSESMEDRFYGFLFQDSDVYKWIEAVAYTLIQHPDADLEQLADQAIEVVCAAQQPNGYLNTFYTINDPEAAFTNLRLNHELYCFGHLAEGAVAYYQATGKKQLLAAAEKYAQYIASRFGSETDKLKGYDGHPIAEMALVRLYEVTGNEHYLKLGEFFIDERGKQPYFYDHESGAEDHDPASLRYQYFQAHLPVRKQETALGHAVRAVYLYAGMADFARLNADRSLHAACSTLWNDITQKKMYITGGIGSTVVGEAFTFAYDLPNAAAYAETCASIGLVFFARRMLQIDPESRYADVMERALYNGILSGMAADGKSFFYVNPLTVYPTANHQDDRLKHARPIRQQWFRCACCPPNIARLISSLASYAFTETENTFFIHLYLGAMIEKSINGHAVVIEIESSFPRAGEVNIHLRMPEPQEFTLALRIPEWAKKYTIMVEGAITQIKQGYLYITKLWSPDETIACSFLMEIKRIKANPFVRETIGKTALMRGPLVYCLEEVDNGNNLHLLSLPREAELLLDHKDCLEGRIPRIHAEGTQIQMPADQSVLYSEQAVVYKPTQLRWIPYYQWANRGEGEMQVWITEA